MFLDFFVPFIFSCFHRFCFLAFLFVFFFFFKKFFLHSGRSKVTRVTKVAMMLTRNSETLLFNFSIFRSTFEVVVIFFSF